MGIEHHTFARLEGGVVRLSVVGADLMALCIAKMLVGECLRETSLRDEIWPELRGLDCGL